jgi:hypothetical protein
MPSWTRVVFGGAAAIGPSMGSRVPSGAPIDAGATTNATRRSVPAEKCRDMVSSGCHPSSAATRVSSTSIAPSHPAPRPKSWSVVLRRS